MDNSNHKIESINTPENDNHSALFASAYGVEHHAGGSTTEKIEDYLKAKFDSVSSTMTSGFKAGEQLAEQIYHAIADFQIVGVAKADTLIDEGGDNYYDANTGEQVNQPTDMGGGFYYSNGRVIHKD